MTNIDKNSPLGRIGDASKDITVGDAVRYIHQKSWIGKAFQKMWIYITGKGKINEEKVKDLFKRIVSLELLDITATLLHKNIKPSKSVLSEKVNNISDTILNPRKKELQDQKEIQDLSDELTNLISQVNEILDKFPATYRQTLKEEYKGQLGWIELMRNMTLNNPNIDKELIKIRITEVKELLDKIVNRKPVLDIPDTPPPPPASPRRIIRFQRGNPKQQPRATPRIPDTSSEKTNTDYQESPVSDSDSSTENSEGTDNSNNSTSITFDSTDSDSSEPPRRHSI